MLGFVGFRQLASLTKPSLVWILGRKDLTAKGWEGSPDFATRAPGIMGAIELLGSWGMDSVNNLFVGTRPGLTTCHAFPCPFLPLPLWEHVLNKGSSSNKNENTHSVIIMVLTIT